MKIGVVALGKIGLPLAVQFAAKGHDVDRCRRQRGRRRPGERGDGAVPGRGRPRREAAQAVVRAGCCARPPTPPAAVPGADAVVVVVPLFVDERGRAGLRLDGRRHPVASPRGLRPGTLVCYETTLPVGTTRTRWAPMLEEGSGLVAGQRLPPRVQPERVLTGRVFADLRKYPKLVGGRRRGVGPARRRVLRGGARLRRAARPAAAERRLGPRLAPRPPSWRSWPRRPTATSTSGWPTSSPGTPTRTASTSCR